MKAILYLCILTLACSGCRKDQKAAFNPDYFIFGTSYGMCRADCTHLFKVSGGQTYPDSIDRGLTPMYFSSVPLDSAKAAIASEVQQALPASVRYSDAEKVIGCPDCRDQGTIYIEYAQAGKVYVIRMDTDETAVPADLRAFCNQLQNAITKLK
ncbi:hypothetical protein [Rurimicrobium arvi]|uniref:Lipoprotein n=1 Tax=Rurimicrobium arvi TaxID=2049916 RepID=A0ABP8MNC4_9BACT